VSTTEVIVRSNGEGERRWFCGGSLHTWKATAEETRGAFLMFEDDLDAGKVTPLHRHPDVDETFYMLEGEILLHVDGDEPSPLSAGGMLRLQTPGTGEAFYRHASEPFIAGQAASPVDFGRVRERRRRAPSSF